MPFRDLREYMAELEKRELLHRVKKEVDWHLEVGAVMKRVFDTGGPAVVFEKVKDSKIPLISGAMGTFERLALGIECPNDLSTIYRKVLQASKNPIPCEVVRDGPCQENVKTGKDIDLFQFPTPHWHPLDSGRFIGTLGVVFARDPETGKGNMGIYREQIHDRDKMGLLASQHMGTILQKYRLRKEPMPVATAIGVDPATLLASCLQSALGDNEAEVAGALLGEPLKMVKCKTIDVEVPATAEIVIEGTVPPDDNLWLDEGPFGEFTGYYGGDRMRRPAVYLSAITHRNNPIYQGTFEGAPPNESATIRTIGHTIGLWDKLLKAGVPGIKDVHERGCAAFIAIVSLERQYYGGHARQVIDAIFAVAGGVKWAIVVDADIDVYNWDQVEWALATRVQPHRDIVVSDAWERGLHLDPSIEPERRPYPRCQSSRIGIDATTKFKGFEWPPAVGPTQKMEEDVKKRWAEYGF